MRKWKVWALAACLLLGGCGGNAMPQAEEKTPPAETEKWPILENTEKIPSIKEDIPDEETGPGEAPADAWRAAYAAFLADKAADAAWIRNPENPEYDPNWAEAEAAETVGSYCLYDIDKDGPPELLMQYGANGYRTTVYGYAGDTVTELGDVASQSAAFYTWPGENAVALNWGRMGGHIVTKISLANGALLEEVVFEEWIEDPDKAYTPVTDIVPGALPLQAVRPTVNLPAYAPLTLPLDRYGAATTRQPVDPARDRQAGARIEAVLTGGGEFYGVTADGFGGDTGEITMEAYLQPGGVTEFADAPLTAAAPIWLDFNGDGQNEALVTLHRAEGDPYGGLIQIVFALGMDGTVYGYCMNYMDSYERNGTVFVSRYDGSETTLAFDGAQAYLYTPGQEMP